MGSRRWKGEGKEVCDMLLFLRRHWGCRHVCGALVRTASGGSSSLPFMHQQHQHYCHSHPHFAPTSMSRSSSSPPPGTTMALSSPIVFRSLRDCRRHVRSLLWELSGVHHSAVPRADEDGEGELDILEAAPNRGGARTLLELHLMAEQFFDALHTNVLLPRDVVHEVDDFPIFLLDCFWRSGGGQTKEKGHLLSEEAIIGSFLDWMDTALPITSLEVAGHYVSFAQLMGLVESFMRYHRGVRWGGGETKKEWLRGGYLLHPWHDTYCPSSRAEQMPYVHLLQWLLRTKPSGKVVGQHTGERDSINTASPFLSSRDDAMFAWHATEPFSPPSWYGGSTGFAALDCGSHSGYMTELLVKAGAQQLVGVDVSMQALGSSEATYREHIRERRSTSHATKRVQFVRCDVLPEGREVTERRQLSPSKESVLAAAAAHRRRTARHHQMPDNPETAASAEIEINSFDLVVFHPPIRSLFPSWSLLQGLSGWLDHPALDAGSCHPHCRLPVLREIVQQLLSPASSSTGFDSGHLHGRKRVVPLVKDGGYAAFILPKMFDMKCALQRISSAPLSMPLGAKVGPDLEMPLSDVVTSALEGPYELILKRRHTLAGMLDPAEAVHRRDMAYIRAFAHPLFRESIEHELNLFYRTQLYVDLVVFRRKDRRNVGHHDEGMGYDSDSNNNNNKKNEGAAKEEPLAFEESFEYTEYLPASGPMPAHHWTEMTPSFSYLENDFFGENGSTVTTALKQQNFLAVGHSISPNTRQKQPGVEGEEWSQANLQTVRQNMQNYRSLFTSELKKKRNGRVRKMALQPLEKQEWYIDEKLIKSEAAKIDLLNDLSRFDMQDWD